jgi:hypothetical protein
VYGGQEPQLDLTFTVSTALHHPSSPSSFPPLTNIMAGQVSILNAATAGSRSSLLKRDRGISAGARKSKPSSGSSRRLRSRNSVIDDWLADEDGSDTYADLEDFLVE